ncbi:hypothetical protein P8452_59037 [Trifolium repens]|nr:hypothetical protein P8452_59037 [Trifolium repens]
MKYIKGTFTIEAYPLVDELTSKISTLNLERAYRLKSRLVALTRRVQKVRDEIKQLMDNDGDMAEISLSSLQNNAADGGVHICQVEDTIDVEFIKNTYI